MKDELLSVLARVSSTQLALESLRAKDTARALELLELELDASVVALGKLAREVAPAERDRVTSTLRMIRQYRRDHPRRVEADLSATAHGLLVRAAREAGAKAGQILDGLD